MTAAEFERQCGEMESVRFSYVGEDGSGKSMCARVHITFPKPEVFVNMQAILFKDESGNSIMLAGVRHIRFERDGKTGCAGYEFTCRRGDSAEESYYFAVSTEKFAKTH